MASKSIIAKHNKIKHLVQKYKQARQELKDKIKDATLDINEKLVCVNQLNAMTRNASISRLYPVCSVTGRTKGLLFYKKFGLSRSILRDLLVKGHIPGVLKVN